MKNFFLLLAAAIILFSSCGKKSSDKKQQTKSESATTVYITRQQFALQNINLRNIELKNLILTSAIISNAGNDFIFIQKEAHKQFKHQHNTIESKAVKEELGDVITFEKIQIKRGVINGSFTEITPLEELDEKAKVASSGAYYLNAMLTNSGAHEH